MSLPRQLFVVALVGVLASSCIIVDGKPYGIGWGGHDTVYGSGHRGAEERSVDEFHAIRMGVPANATVVVGEATSLKLSGDDDLLAHIKTDVRNGVLKIDMPGKYQFREKLTLEITTPELQAFEIEGSGDVRVQGVDASFFNAAIEGSGDMTVGGRVERLNATIEGSGDLRLQNLTASEANVSIEGSGDIAVQVSRALSYSIEGSGDIRYVGSPHVSGSIEGSGSVRKKR